MKKILVLIILGTFSLIGIRYAHSQQLNAVDIGDVGGSDIQVTQSSNGSYTQEIISSMSCKDLHTQFQAASQSVNRDIQQMNMDNSQLQILNTEISSTGC